MAKTATTALTAKTIASTAQTHVMVIMSGHCAFMADRVNRSTTVGAVGSHQRPPRQDHRAVVGAPSARIIACAFPTWCWCPWLTAPLETIPLPAAPWDRLVSAVAACYRIS